MINELFVGIDVAKAWLDVAVIGSNVAYEHIAKGVYGSVAFWLSNGKRHPRCPVNLLFEDKTVQKVLGV